MMTWTSLKQKLRREHCHLTELKIIIRLKIFLMIKLLLYKTSLKLDFKLLRHQLLLTKLLTCLKKVERDLHHC